LNRRKKEEGFRNSAGDLALRWEVARGLALRTPHICRVFCYRGPQDPHDTGNPRFPIGGDLVNPGCLCSSCYRCFFAQEWLSPLFKGSTCRFGTAGEELGQHDRRETHPPCIGGPDGPGGVVSSISTSSRDEVTERPGWQPRGLPDLSNFD